MFAVLFKRTKWIPLAAMLSAILILSVYASGWLETAEVQPKVDKELQSSAASYPPPAYPVSAREAEAGDRAEVVRQASFFDFLERKHFRSVEVVATGYYAGRESTGKSPGHPEYGITYSGVKVKRGLFSTIAADPAVFPIGTILYIPGYGFGVVADTGSAIKGRKIDLYFETKQQVYDEWGKQTVRVSVLRRGDGRLSEASMTRLNERQAFLPSQKAAEPY